MDENKAKIIANAMTENTSWGVDASMVNELATIPMGTLYYAQHGAVTILCCEHANGEFTFASACF